MPKVDDVQEREGRTKADLPSQAHGPKLVAANDSDLESPAGASDAQSARMHVVLVPGFGGFDALGQINYYQRTSETAGLWRAKFGDDRLVLHYFDNLPTAGVDTRAERLLRYLLVRCERNDFQDGDKIALIGHSTGGLDIRRLLNELFEIHHKAVWEQTSEVPESQQLERLRTMIKRVVFMSVPQRGTNIANWTRSMMVSRRLLLSWLRVHYDVIDLPLLERLDTAIWTRLQALRLALPEALQDGLESLLPDLYQAIFDVNTEVSQRVDDNPIRAAKGREALSQLNLYLSQTQADFLAINDLAVADPERWQVGKILGRLLRPGTDSPTTTRPASLDEAARERERAAWTDHGIEVLSFATVAPPPFDTSRLGAPNKLAGFRALLQIIPMPGRGSDGPFRLAYRACATGPFDQRMRGESDATYEAAEFATTAEQKPEPFDLAHAKRVTIQSWENDGIVNTASMLWPNGADTRLVQGDHADIIGHFGPALEAKDKKARKFAAYDIFGSDSGFNVQRFEKVWLEAFTHCMSALAASSLAAHSKR